MAYTEEPSTSPEPPPPPSSSSSTGPEVKLIDRITNYRKNTGKPFFSLEFFPPRNETELTSFWPLLDQLREGGPLFMDITWHTRTSLDPNNSLSSLGIAGKMIKSYNHETVLHLICSQYDELTMESILNSAKSNGIKNILALRGDAPVRKDDVDSKKDKDDSNNINNSNPDESNQLTVTNDPLKSNVILSDDPLVVPKIESNDGKIFSCALDLVKFIRTKFGDYFTLGVAGYPMGHPDGKSYSDDLNYLKSKVEAGADFIVTQLSFSADQYLTFIKDCRTAGIEVPIIPGIFPIQTQISIRNITKLTQIEPPDEIKKAIDDCKGDVKAIRQYGLRHVVDLCTKLINSDVDIPGLHFYTLNRDNCVSNSLKQLDLWNTRSNQMESNIEPHDTNLLTISPAARANDLVTELIVS